jgi:hypothetical protein
MCFLYFLQDSVSVPVEHLPIGVLMEAHTVLCNVKIVCLYLVWLGSFFRLLILIIYINLCVTKSYNLRRLHVDLPCKMLLST